MTRVCGQAAVVDVPDLDVAGLGVYSVLSNLSVSLAWTVTSAPDNGPLDGRAAAARGEGQGDQRGRGQGAEHRCAWPSHVTGGARRQS